MLRPEPQGIIQKWSQINQPSPSTALQENPPGQRQKATIQARVRISSRNSFPGDPGWTGGPAPSLGGAVPGQSRGRHRESSGSPQGGSPGMASAAKGPAVTRSWSDPPVDRFAILDPPTPETRGGPLVRPITGCSGHGSCVQTALSDTWCSGVAMGWQKSIQDTSKAGQDSRHIDAPLRNRLWTEKIKNKKVSKGIYHQTQAQ